jgi:ABC-type dipeptide/oligopeptide/nickel transport system permease subunit
LPDNNFDVGGTDPAGEILIVHEDQTRTAPAAPAPATGTDREFTVQARTQRSIIWRRFRQHKLAMVSSGVLLFIVLFAFVGQLLWHFKYNVSTEVIQAHPSLTYPFGTDTNGNDEMSLIMRGTQRSLEIAFSVSILSTVIGTVVGAVAGYYRGVIDSVLMRVVDLVLTIPVIVIGVMLDDKFQQASSWWGLSLVLSGVFWAGTSRVIRGQVLSLREKEFVEAARALGASDRRIIFRHILPNVAGTLVVVVTLSIAGTILTESALSFLGFGVKFPDTSLGLLVTSGQNELQSGQTWLFYFPGLFIILIALSANFIGDGLRDAFDPTQTRVRA